MASRALVLLAFVALFAVALAADPAPKTEPEHYRHEHHEYEHHPKHKIVELFVPPPAVPNNGVRTPLDDAPLGVTNVEVLSKRALSETPTGPIIGYWWQSGIIVDNSTTAKEVNYQVTVQILNDGYHLPEGKIFLIGDGTALSDPNFGPKAIVGGTGPYVGAQGIVTRATGPAGVSPNPNPYVFKFINW